MTQVQSFIVLMFVFVGSGCPDSGVRDDAETQGDSSETDTAPDGDTTPGDTDPTDDTSETHSPDGDTDVEPGPWVVGRHGARMIGAPIQLSLTDTGHGRFLWVGTRANTDPSDGRLRGGLFRYDVSRGAVLRIEDRLPREDYGDAVFGPAATAGVQADGDRFVVVARTGLLSLTGDEPDVGAVVVTHAGAALVPIQLAIARDGLRPVAWMTSDVGLARLDEDTFAVEAIVRGEDLGIAGDTGGDFGRLAVDPDTGAVYASYFTSDGRSALVKVGVDNQRRVWLTGDGGPRGRVGELVFSKARGGVFAALASWSAAEGGVVFWDGSTVEPLVHEGPLAEAHRGESGAFGAHSLALDEVNGVLAVGGQLQSGLGGIRGGGLALVDLEAEVPRVIGVAGRESPLLHWHVQGLVWDPVGHELFMVASDLCNESRLRARGLFGVRFVNGTATFRRPFVSSVRALAEVDGQLVGGMRDDNGGLACDSVPVQAGIGRLESGGLGLWPVVSVAGDGITLDPGVTAIHAGDGGLALGTWRDGFLVGDVHDGGVEGLVGNPALLGPSLFLEAVLARPTERGREVWLAGRTSHQPGDPPVVADRGPRGMARIEVEDGTIGPVTHIVRASDDPADVVGLPSGDVRDLRFLGDGVIAACALERLAPNYDRDERPAFELDGATRGGGVARVSGGEVTVLADASVTPDPRALALDPAGRLVVADAQRGVLRSKAALDTTAAFEPVATPGLIAGSRPIRVWAGAGDDLAVATSEGVWARLGGRVVVVDDVGFAWSLLWRDGVLWVGTDEGLVSIAPEGHPATLPARAPGEAPFRPR